MPNMSPTREVIRMDSPSIVALFGVRPSLFTEFWMNSASAREKG